MSKEMNFILCILLMYLPIIFISSTVKEAEAIDEAKLRKECETSFAVFDVDGDGAITEQDIEKFMISPGSSFLPNKDLFKRSIIKAIEDHCGGRMDFEKYFEFMKKQEVANPTANYAAVQAMFPGKTRVTRDQLCQKIPKLNKEHLEASYTIQEIVDLVFNPKKEEETDKKSEKGMTETDKKSEKGITVE